MIKSIVRGSTRPIIRPIISGGGPIPKIQFDGNINIVTLSASVMNQTFKFSQRTRERFYNSGGLVVQDFNRSTSGHTVEDTLAGLPAILAEFAGQEANTIFLYHGPGNNVSQGDPYPNNVTAIEVGVRQVFEDVIAAGFYIASSNLTYRIPPVNQSIQYNENVIEPLIEELLPLWSDNGAAFIDMYTLYFDNQANMADLIHPDDTLEEIGLDYWASKMSEKIVQSNPSPVSMKDVVVACGGAQISGELPNILESDDELLRPSNIGEEGFNIFGSTGNNTTLQGNTGRGNAGDTTESLTNDYLLTWFLYSADDIVQTVNVDVGLDYDKTYTVSVTASRNTTATDRITDYTIGGITKQVDAAANPPEIQTWTGVTGQQLLDNGIQWARAAGSTFGYLNGFRVTEE